MQAPFLSLSEPPGLLPPHSDYLRLPETSVAQAFGDEVDGVTLAGLDRPTLARSVSARGFGLGDDEVPALPSSPSLGPRQPPSSKPRSKAADLIL